MICRLMKFRQDEFLAQKLPGQDPIFDSVPRNARVSVKTEGTRTKVLKMSVALVGVPV